MGRLDLTMEFLDAAVLGGCVLGGGGGGSMVKGYHSAKLALELAPIALIDPEDLEENAVLINVSNVGAPSSKEAWVDPLDYGRAVTMLCEKAGISPGGIITNEAGGGATVNGWLQSALSGIPVVDAPCNGRAHPTGVMGSMGLHRLSDYRSILAAVGGRRALGHHVEMMTEGSLSGTARLVREAAVEAGGLVAVARNPVTCGYAKEHGACHSVRQAIQLGQVMLAVRDKGADAVLRAVCDFLKGTVLVSGQVDRVDLTCSGGFDAGTVWIGDVELTFWNEYMTAERKGARIATFPDLIMTFDVSAGKPVTSAEIRKGMTAAVLIVPSENLLLGAGMRDPELYAPCEKAVEKEMVSYAFPEAKDEGMQ